MVRKIENKMMKKNHLQIEYLAAVVLEFLEHVTIKI